MKHLICLFSFLVLMYSCNAQKTNSTYQSIEIETLGCHGFCPIYKMKINPADRTAILEAERFNFPDSDGNKDYEGTFKTTLKKEDFNQLMTMLQKMNTPSLKSFYGDKRMVDLPTAFLRLEYQNGVKQQVQDWGKNGTPELQNLYQFFEELKHNQKWEKTGDTKPND